MNQHISDATSQPHILLVDDEPAIIQNLAPFLQRSGFAVTVAEDGVIALEKIGVIKPDLIVLDVLMPRLDGRAVLRQVRQAQNQVPVILLTQVGESVERAMALDEGADDYLNKPFDPYELVARIRSVLRRAQAGQPSLTTAQQLRSGDLTLNRTAQRVYWKQNEITLTPKAIALLTHLMLHPNELMTREQLLDAVWGWDYPTGTRTVDTRIAELRRALADDSAAPTYIETVPGQGYRFIAPIKIGS